MDEDRDPRGAGPSDPARYEKVREELRRRGYLEGRIERFVLREMVSAGSAVGRRLRPALKAALIGAPLLGALLAGTAAAANRPLLEARDLALLWCYFTLVSAVVLAVLDVAAATVVAALAGRRGARSADAPVAALLVALPLLGYLLLLWWTRRPQGGPLGDSLFLAAALLTTLFVAWLAGLVSLAGIIGRTGQVPDRLRRAVLLLVAALLPLCLGLLVARSAFGTPDGPREPSAFSPASDGRRLLLVGVDGLDGGIVAALEPRGAVAGLLRAMASGAVFPLAPGTPAEPPEVWTTLLTGMTAEAHGVKSAGATRLPGVATPLRRAAGPLPLEAALRWLLPTRTVPASGGARRVRALWEIVALARPALAVGWWASWPAVEARGSYVVTDRVLPKLLSGGAGDRDTAPPSLFERLRADFEDDRRALRASFEGAVPRRPEGSIDSWLWESYLIDAYALRVTERLLGDPALQAAFVYLPGLDILRHRLASRDAGGGVPALLETQAALEGYVRALDGLLDPLLVPQPGRNVLLIADPGRQGVAGDEGLVLALGDGVRPGCVGRPLARLELAPLVLGLAGYPGSLEMAAAPEAGCLGSLPGATAPVATYGRREPPEGPVSSDYDAEMVRRLRSLGYLN